MPDRSLSSVVPWMITVLASTAFVVVLLTRQALQVPLGANDLAVGFQPAPPGLPNAFDAAAGLPLEPRIRFLHGETNLVDAVRGIERREDAQDAVNAHLSAQVAALSREVVGLRTGLHQAQADASFERSRVQALSASLQPLVPHCSAPTRLVGTDSAHVIGDSAITTSANSYATRNPSVSDWQAGASRIDGPTGVIVAIPGECSRDDRWIRWDLGSERTVTAVETQGRKGMDEWVTAYRLSWSRDGEEWETPSHLYAGNSDENTKVTHSIEPRVVARYVKLIPHACYSYGGFRADFFGCDAS